MDADEFFREARRATAWTDPTKDALLILATENDDGPVRGWAHAAFRRGELLGFHIGGAPDEIRLRGGRRIYG